jgi:septum formation protein
MDKAANIYLASSSPRRYELLQQLGVNVIVLPVDVDETAFSNENPSHYVERLARAKAEQGRQHILQYMPHQTLPVLGADTTVVFKEHLFGKPQHQADAAHMLSLLSGNTHQVMTAVAIAHKNKILSHVNITEVTFRSISPAEQAQYWQSGEPCDKAGGYAIQGKAAIFIEKIEGSFSGVMGLPLFETAQLLHAFGVEVLHA